MKLITYLRVSTDSQDSGLEMQRAMTADFAMRFDHDIIEVFEDRAISGGIASREGFDRLKDYITKNGSKEFMVLIYDISRIARDVSIGEEFIKLCWKTQTKIITSGGDSYDFAQHSDRMRARMMFVFATADKEKKNEDSFNGMRRALESGRYIFQPKPGSIKGYRYEKIDKIKQLVPFEPEASIIKEALELYANDQLNTLVELKQWFEDRGLHFNKARNESIKFILTSPLYCGYVEYLPWGISKRKAVHEPLISEDLWDKIQSKVNGRNSRKLKHGTHDDVFFFRKFGMCPKCKNHLTAHTIYNRQGNAYKSYYCSTRNCELFKKHINGEKLENLFLELIKTTKFSKSQLETIRDTLICWINNQAEIKQNTAKTLNKELKNLDTQIKTELEQLKRVSNAFVFKSLENSIQNLENERNRKIKELKECEVDTETSRAVYLTQLDRSLIYLENLDKFWSLGDLAIKKLVYKTIFEGGLTVEIGDKGSLHLTPHFSCFYAFCRDLLNENSEWWSSVALKPNFNILSFYTISVEFCQNVSYIDQAKFDQILAL
jgi:DNA invertase Pin-like site-specific DNA recombinase